MTSFLAFPVAMRRSLKALNRGSNLLAVRAARYRHRRSVPRPPRCCACRVDDLNRSRAGLVRREPRSVFDRADRVQGVERSRWPRRRARSLDAPQTRRLVTQVIVLLDHGFHLSFDFRLAALQGPHMLQNTASYPLVRCRSQPVLLGDNHGGDIVAMRGKVRQTLAFCRAWGGGSQLEGSSHLCEDRRINAVTLGQASRGARKFSCMPRVHAYRISLGVG